MQKSIEVVDIQIKLYGENQDGVRVERFVNLWVPYSELFDYDDLIIQATNENIMTSNCDFKIETDGLTDLKQRPYSFKIGESMVCRGIFKDLLANPIKIITERRRLNWRVR